MESDQGPGTWVTTDLTAVYMTRQGMSTHYNHMQAVNDFCTLYIPP